MKSINLTNVGIIAGALAVFYLLSKTMTKRTGQGLATATQYGNQWDEFPKFDDKKLTYV